MVRLFSGSTREQKRGKGAEIAVGSIYFRPPNFTYSEIFNYNRYG